MRKKRKGCSTVIVVITTGRPSYRQAAASIRNNIRHWQPAATRVDLLINFDISYQDTGIKDFTDPPCPPLMSNGEVFYAGASFIREADWLAPSERAALESISPATGYGQKKNACLMFALRHKYDVILFWDDDEYALHIERESEGQCARWVSSNIIDAHTRPTADVTFGFWTGYVSPIPDSFFEEINQSTKEMLTSALEPITDVVDQSTFFSRTSTYCILPAQSRPIVEISETRGGKWVSGGNLGLRRAAVIAGRLPAFYTPTDSRGDDSIFSVGLRDAVVMRTDAGIFHDAFGTLIAVDCSQLVNPPIYSKASGRAAERFAGVIRGWLAYAPILSVLRGLDNVTGLVNECADRLSTCDEALLSYLGSSWRWQEPSALLRSYLAAVESEVDAYHRTQQVWRRLCAR